VFKVINEMNNWQCYARFMKNGAGVKNIQSTADEAAA